MNVLLIVLLGLGLAGMQILIGGVKMVYSLPVYVVLGVAGIVTAVWCRRQPSARPSIWCLLSTLLLAGYLLWRAVTAPVDYLARTDFYMIGGALVVYLIVAIHLVSPRYRLALLWVLFALALIHVGTGIVQFKEKGNFMLLPWILRADYGYRASGFYICPNHLAGLLELIGMLSLSIAVWGRGKTWSRLVAAYVALMCLVGIAITGSRGGYLSTVVGLAAFAVLSLIVVRKVKRRWFWGGLVLALLGSVGVVGGAMLAMRKSADLDRRLGTVYDPTNMRIFMWKAALKAHELSPWTGVGSGSYLFYGRHFRDRSVQNDAQHVHNDYLELLTEYGIIGSALMLVFLGAHVGSGFGAIGGIIRTRLKPFGLARSNELAVVLGILSGLAALAAHSVPDFNMHIPGNVMLVAVFFGILANPRTPVADEEVRRRASGVIVRLTPALLGILLVVVAVPRVRAEYCAERARMALRDHLHDKAIGYAERGIGDDPRNPNLYYYLGESKHDLGMYSNDPVVRKKFLTEAAAAFAEGIKHFPADLQLLLALGRTLDNLGRFPEADYVFRVALQADPNFANVYSYYGYHFYLQRRLIRAEKLYAKAVELGDDQIAPLGLTDVDLYRFHASDEEKADQYPIEDQPGDDTWEPGEP